LRIRPFGGKAFGDAELGLFEIDVGQGIAGVAHNEMS
jgi:hypothetical protein